MNNSQYFLLEYGVEIINLPKTDENRNIEQFQHLIRNKSIEKSRCWVELYQLLFLKIYGKRI